MTTNTDQVRLSMLADGLLIQGDLWATVEIAQADRTALKRGRERWAAFDPTSGRYVTEEAQRARRIGSSVFEVRQWWSGGDC